MDQNLKKRIDKVNREHSNLEGKISVHQEEIDTLPSKKTELVDKETNLKKISSHISTQKKRIASIKKKIDTLSARITEYNTISKNFKDVKITKTRNEQNLRGYKQKQLKYEDIKNQLKQFIDLSEELKETQKIREGLKDKSSQKTRIEDRIEHEKSSINRTEKLHHNQIQKLNQDINKERKRLKALSSDMNKDQAFKLLKKVGQLTERLSRLQNIEIPMAKEFSDDKRLDLFSTSENVTTKKLEEIESQEDMITEDIFIAEELTERITKIEHDLTDQEKKKTSDLKHLIEKKLALEKEIEDKKLNQNFEQQLSKVEKTLASLESKQKQKELLDKNLSNQQDQTALIQKAQEDLIEINKKLEQSNKDLENLKPTYDEYQKLSGELEEVEMDLNSFEASREGVNVRIQIIKDEIQKLQTLKKKIQGDKKKLNAIKREIEVHTILRKKIFHLDGIPKFALEKILPAISIRASEILGDLTEGRLNHIEFKSLEDHRVGFDIYVHDGESVREAGTFSGGEKTQINAAIRFAIMERIDEIPDTTGAIFRKSDTLFIDEGDLGTLDDDSSRQLFVDKIMDMNNRFKNIILITHLEDVAEQFPNRIKIGRDKDGKSKILG